MTRASDPVSPGRSGVDNPSMAGDGHPFNPLGAVTSPPPENGKLSSEAAGMFRGRARARVVAPEMKIDGSKEFVVFKIRVADETGEWTVARRWG